MGESRKAEGTSEDREIEFKIVESIKEERGKRVEELQKHLEKMQSTIEEKEGFEELLQKLNAHAIKEKEEELENYIEYARSLEDTLAQELERRKVKVTALDEEPLFIAASLVLCDQSSLEFALAVNSRHVYADLFRIGGEGRRPSLTGTETTAGNAEDTDSEISEEYSVNLFPL